MSVAAEQLHHGLCLPGCRRLRRRRVRGQRQLHLRRLSAQREGHHEAGGHLPLLHPQHRKERGRHPCRLYAQKGLEEDQTTNGQGGCRGQSLDLCHHQGGRKNPCVRGALLLFAHVRGVADVCSAAGAGAVPGSHHLQAEPDLVPQPRKLQRCPQPRPRRHLGGSGRAAALLARQFEDIVRLGALPLPLPVTLQN